MNTEEFRRTMERAKELGLIKPPVSEPILKPVFKPVPKTVQRQHGIHMRFHPSWQARKLADLKLCQESFDNERKKL